MLVVQLDCLIAVVFLVGRLRRSCLVIEVANVVSGWPHTENNRCLNKHRNKAKGTRKLKNPKTQKTIDFSVGVFDVHTYISLICIACTHVWARRQNPEKKKGP